MASSDRAAGALDALIRGFAERGYAPEGADLEEEPAHGHAGHAHGGVREFVHRGHRVRIATHYEVTIDGERWEQQLLVGHDGSVTYHGLPQYVVPSAVDLVRAVIDHSYEAPEAIRAAVAAARREA